MGTRTRHCSRSQGLEKWEKMLAAPGIKSPEFEHQIRRNIAEKTMGKWVHDIELREVERRSAPDPVIPVPVEESFFRRMIRRVHDFTHIGRRGNSRSFRPGPEHSQAARPGGRNR